MKTGSLVKIRPGNSCLGLCMDNGLPYMLRENNIMLFFSFSYIDGFCNVLLLEQTNPVVLLVSQSVLELAEEND